MIRTGDLVLFDPDALRFDLLGPAVAKIRSWLAARTWLRRRPRYAAAHRAAPGESTMVVRAREVTELRAFPEMAPVAGLIERPAPLTPPTYPVYPGYEELARLGGTVRPPLIRPARYFDDEVTVPDPQALPRRLAPDWRMRTGEMPYASIGEPGELVGVR